VTAGVCAAAAFALAFAFAGVAAAGTAAEEEAVDATVCVSASSFSCPCGCGCAACWISCLRACNFLASALTPAARGGMVVVEDENRIYKCPACCPDTCSRSAHWSGSLKTQKRRGGCEAEKGTERRLSAAATATTRSETPPTGSTAPGASSTAFCVCPSVMRTAMRASMRRQKTQAEAAILLQQAQVWKRRRCAVGLCAGAYTQGEGLDAHSSCARMGATSGVYCGR
jgi:hypothetical protein